MTEPAPVFATARLLLRPRTLSDLEDCFAMDRDPEVTRFIDGPWADPEAHRAFVEDRIRRAYPAGMGYWSIIADDGFAGWVLLTPLDLRGPGVEIGWRLRRAVWGRGLAAGAARPVLDHALGRLAWRRPWLISIRRTRHHCASSPSSGCGRAAGRPMLDAW